MWLRFAADEDDADDVAQALMRRMLPVMMLTMRMMLTG